VSSSFAPPPPDALETHQVHECTTGSFNICGGSQDQPVPEVAVQDARLERVPELSTSTPASEDSYDHCGSNGNDDGFGAVVGLCGDDPLFCMVGDCRYWHTDPKQIGRHRDRHFSDRGYLCPNQTDTCPSRGHRFSRSDAVNVHCKTYKMCGDSLEANNRVIQRWGSPVAGDDLRKYDPNFHIPYKFFDGRNGRSGRKCQN